MNDERSAKEPTLLTDNVVREMTAWAGIWLGQGLHWCDWCRVPLRHFTDLRSYIDFCRSLGKLWPSDRRRLPAAKVFCNECAPGAILELIDGVKFVVGNTHAAEGDGTVDVPF